MRLAITVIILFFTISLSGCQSKEETVSTPEKETAPQVDQPSSAQVKQPEPSTNRTADYIEPATGMPFIKIPAGSFLMGDLTGEDAESLPIHRVHINEFYMGAHEVTFAQYAPYRKEMGLKIPDDSGWGRGNRPVINVSWNDAVQFARWLSNKTGKKFRLPSEAEWEYAARGGTMTRFYWGAEVGKNNANCAGCGMPWDGKQDMTSEVGSFPANPFGLFDMAGNVYEWIYDSRHENYDGAPTDGSAWRDDPHEPQRITRSGSWDFDPAEATSARRCWDGHDHKSNDTGFRLVMEP